MQKVQKINIPKTTQTYKDNLVIAKKHMKNL